MKLKKLISNAAALVFALQAVSITAVTSYAEKYDTICSVSETSIGTDSWTGRAQAVAAASVGGKMYMYVGLANANNSVGTGTGGLVVMDITDPQNPVQKSAVTDGSIYIKDAPYTENRLLSIDDCLYVANGKTSKTEIYRISSTDGTLTKITDIDGYGTQSMTLSGNYLFISGNQYNNPESVKIYDVSNPSEPSRINASADKFLPTVSDEVTEQIATLETDVVDMGDGKYRLFAHSRAKISGTDTYFLTISDIEISDGTYTYSRLYEGRPADTGYSSTISGIAAVDINTIAVIDNDRTAGSADMLKLIDVSDPQNPKASTGTNNTTGRAQGIMVDGNDIILSSTDSSILVYNYNSSDKSLTKTKTISVGSQLYETKLYSGYLLAASQSYANCYEYSTGISIDTTSTDAYNAKITGTVDGYLDGDVVTVSCGGHTYYPVVSGRRYFAVDLGVINAGTLNVTAALSRNGAEINTAAAQVAANDTLQSVRTEDFEALSKTGHISKTNTSCRVTSVDFYETNGKKFAYVAQGLQGSTAADYSELMVVDITDPASMNSVAVYTDINTNIWNNQVAVKNDNLYVLQSAGTTGLYRYPINSDGTLGNGVKIEDFVNNDTIVIDGNYLFHSKGGTTANGLTVFDVTDASAPQRIVDFATDYGLYSPDFVKTETGYRVYGGNRLKTGGTWGFAIMDITVNGESWSFETKYSGQPDANLINYINIPDVEYIGNGKVVVTDSTGGSKKGGNIINVDDVTNPTVIEGAKSQTFSLMDINNDYYAMGYANGSVKVYDKSSNEVVKNLTGSASGSVYEMKMYDGNLILASQDYLTVCGPFYTAFNVTDTTVYDNLTVKVDGFKSGDALLAYADGANLTVTSSNDGSFTVDAADVTDGADVKLILERNGVMYIADTVKITKRAKYPYTITGVSYENNTAVVSITNNYACAEAVLAYVVVYDEQGKLSAVDVVNVATPSVTANVSFDPTKQTLKVFIWTSELTPMADSYLYQNQGIVSQNF